MTVLAERSARTIWKGDLTSGQGELSTESSGVLASVPVTWASRTEQPGGRTSPEELLAAAHAACYAMALSNTLAS
jgi:osmotically inducible protein OsmC